MKDLAEAIGTEPLCRVLMIHDLMGKARKEGTQPHLLRSAKLVFWPTAPGYV